jgi:hypothetical protein
VAVEQLAHQAGAGFGVAIVDGGQQGFAFVAEETVDGLVRFRRQAPLSSSSCTASATGR